MAYSITWWDMLHKVRRQKLRGLFLKRTISVYSNFQKGFPIDKKKRRYVLEN